MSNARMLEKYRRAEQMLPWNVISKVRNIEVRPIWLADGRLTYRKELEDGCEYVLIDSDLRTKQPLFNHEKFAEELSAISEQTVDSNQLPLEEFHYDEASGALSFSALGYRCSLAVGEYCDAEILISSNKKLENLQVGQDSPNRLYRFVLDEWDVAIQDLKSGSIRKLTNDGSRLRAYGKSPEANLVTVTSNVSGIPRKPIGKWSPDGKKILTHRLNEEDVRQVEIIQNVPNKDAICHNFRMPFPGDESLGSSDLIIFDVDTGEVELVDIEPFPIQGTSPLEMDLVWWGKDSNSLYTVRRSRYEKEVRFEKVDLEEGSTRPLYSEVSDTFVEMSATLWNCEYQVLEDRSEFIVYSKKDGWGHLYLHDLETGNLKAQLTSGEWSVFEILDVDGDEGIIYFVAGGRESGRDPYFRHLYRLEIDSSKLKLLTPEDADHSIIAKPNPLRTTISPHAVPSTEQGISINHGMFVDTFSTAETVPSSVLRRLDGQKKLKLETASLEELERQQWTWPERFEVTSRDGSDPLFGVIHRPSDFDPSKKYPVIDVVYPGPHAIRTSKSSFVSELSMLGWFLQPQMLAELGFVTVTIDGLGTPFRSKKFQDFAYKNMKDCGIPDHISGIRQLAASRQYMDLSRVGIIGHSAGGYAAARALLEHGDFYTVGVSSTGSHDPKRYSATFVEQYLGEFEDDLYSDESNIPIAKNLKGKLMLSLGDLDENVHPSITIELVDALVKAKKDHELVVVPGGDHTVLANGYLIKRQWDFLIQHLLGEEPPEFEIYSPRFD